MSFERVIALIDMDCFYVQCEQRLSPDLWSHPCAVAQYNNWKGFHSIYKYFLSINKSILILILIL